MVPHMEISNEFVAGYREALRDIKNHFGDSTLVYRGAFERFIEQQTERVDDFERVVGYLTPESDIGTDFCETIFGSGTGPQDGLRRVQDS